MDGRQTILEYLKTGDVFGSALSALSPNGDSLQVICTKSCKIQFIDYAHLIRRCPNACSFHSLLVSNALQLISRKAIALGEHLEILSQRTTKEKLLCYFEKLAQEQHSDSFTLPFSLSTLAGGNCKIRTQNVYLSRISSKLNRIIYPVLPSSSEKCTLIDSRIKICFKHTFRCPHGQNSEVEILILDRDVVFKHHILLKF